MVSNFNYSILMSFNNANHLVYSKQSDKINLHLLKMLQAWIHPKLLENLLEIYILNGYITLEFKHQVKDM
jgi:hypothetical protein